MKCGALITSWSEPAECRRAMRGQAREGGGPATPWGPALLVWGAASLLFFFRLMERYEGQRPPLPVVIGISLGLGLLAPLALLIYMGLNRTVTRVHEEGIAHGPRFSVVWYPWPEIRHFCVAEEEVDGVSLRHLVWQSATEGEELVAFASREVDLDAVAAHLRQSGVKEVAADDGVWDTEEDT